MIRFIHTADIHLDSPLRGLSQYEDAPVEVIRGATRRALANVVEVAIENKVDFVIIAGDLYDGDWLDYSTGQFFTHQMRVLRDADILVYLISGNHDAESKITKTLNLPNNVHRFSTKKPESISHPNLPVTLHGQGFANQAQQENLAQNYPAAIASHLNIGILHTSLAGDSQHDTYAPCSVAELNAKSYQYWALGHIHQEKVVQPDPPVIFSGNPQGRHIRETGERGCYLVTADDDLEISDYQFIATDVVRWFSSDVDITGLKSRAEINEKIAAAIGEIYAEINGCDRLQLAAFRLILTGSTAMHGELHTGLKDLQANCHEITQDIDSDSLWLERVRLSTSPIIDLGELATRDELSALVIAALQKFDPTGNTSDNIKKLESKLDGMATSELAPYFTPDADEAQQLSDDVAAIVLQSISHSA